MGVSAGTSAPRDAVRHANPLEQESLYDMATYNGFLSWVMDLEARMDRLAGVDEIEREIDETMREQGIERAAAQLVVGLHRGELHGDGDLLSLRPLTADQKRRLRLGRSIDEVLDEQHRRENR